MAGLTSLQETVIGTLQGLATGAYFLLSRPLVLLIEYSDDRFRYMNAYHRHS